MIVEILGKGESLICERQMLYQYSKSKQKKTKKQKDNPGSYRLVSLENIIELAPFKDFSGYEVSLIEGVIRFNQNGFTKGKSCLTNLIILHDRITGFVNKGKAREMILL